MIVCVRHGETAWSVSGQHTGRTDIPLTDDGREQARAAGKRLAGRDFALVLTSPLGRARETAALCGHPDAEADDDLMEWDYGDAEGRTSAELRDEQPGWDIFADGPPGGETVAQIGARADRVIERVLRVDGDVALFAHGHLLRVLGARWVQQPPAFGERLKLDTAAICELEVYRGARVITRWNT